MEVSIYHSFLAFLRSGTIHPWFLFLRQNLWQKSENDEASHFLCRALLSNRLTTLEVLLSPKYKVVPVKHWSEMIFPACKLIMSHAEKQHTPILSIYIRYLYPILIIYVSSFVCIINICILCRESMLCLAILSINIENTLFIVQYLIPTFRESSN